MSGLREIGKTLRSGLMVACLPAWAVCAAQALGAQALAAQTPLDHSTQLIVVTTPDWNAIHGTLQRYQRANSSQGWKRVGDSIAVVVGKGGMGWGDGFAQVPGQAAGDPIKHEGDGKSPAGIFQIGTAFGYAPQEPSGWALPYLPLTEATECVDDPHSQHYNRIVNRSDTTPDWNSSEHMRSEGVYYEWGAVIDQNAAARRGDGSCVFLHISDGGPQGTEGCTAMAKPQLQSVLGWLRPGADPLLVEMPEREYRQAKKALSLP